MFTKTAETIRHILTRIFTQKKKTIQNLLIPCQLARNNKIIQTL